MTTLGTYANSVSPFITASTHGQWRASAPTFKPAALPSGDRVTFGSQPVSPAEALARVNQQALTLFPANADASTLVSNFSKIHGDVAVYDGKNPDQAWVNTVCRELGVVAFNHVPDSIRFNQDPNKVPHFDDEGGVFPKAFTDEALPKLYQNKQLAVFLSSGSSRGVLIEELYHLKQVKAGLPFGTGNMDVDMAAKDYNNRYNRHIFSGIHNSLSNWQSRQPTWLQWLTQPANLALGTVGALGNLAKRLFSWGVEVPYIMAKRALGIIKTNPNSAGQALRNEMEREQEVDAFMFKNASSLGLSLWERWSRIDHWLCESKLKALLSYKLEHITPETFQKPAHV